LKYSNVTSKDPNTTDICVDRHTNDVTVLTIHEEVDEATATLTTSSDGISGLQL
jgi:hypothetical protein